MSNSTVVYAWTPDEEAVCCMTCANRFTLLMRRHHCRLCGQVICGDCSRVRASLTQFPEREVRICLECACGLQCEAEHFNPSVAQDFIRQTLLASDDEQSRQEKIQLQIALQQVQTKIREQEKLLVDSMHGEEVGSTNEKKVDSSNAPPSSTPRRTSLSAPESSTTSKSKSSSPNGSRSTTPAPPTATTAIVSIPPVPSSPSSAAASPYFQQMTAYATELQTLQQTISSRQIRDGLLLQVVFTNINSNSMNEVWMNTQTTNNNGNGVNETVLNTGLYRYLLILPPPHRMVCMSSLLFPPTPLTSTRKSPTAPLNAASQAIQHQIHQLQQSRIIEAPMEVAREFFSVFTKESDDEEETNEHEKDGEKKSKSKQNPSASEQKVDQESSIKKSTESPSLEPAQPASMLSPEELPENSRPRTNGIDLISDSIAAAPPAVTSPISPDPPAPIAASETAPTSTGHRIRWYAVRGLDEISSIRPLDFRPPVNNNNAGSSNSMQPLKGFSINFHPYCARTSANLPHAIVNRRDENVLERSRTSWNCIIVDEAVKAAQKQLAEEVKKRIPPTVADEQKQDQEAKAMKSLSPPIPPTSKSTSPSASKPQSKSASPQPSPKISPSQTPASSPSPSPAPTHHAPTQSFFTSLFNAFTARPNPPDPPARMTLLAGLTPSPAAIAAAQASAELAHQVQRYVISQLHGCSIGYYTQLIQLEVKQIKQGMRDMKTTVKWEEPEHEALLERMWKSWSVGVILKSKKGAAAEVEKQPEERTNSVQSQESPPFPGHVSEHWKLLGFQGTNPCTDFRGVGLLSLHVLVYLGEKYPELIHVLMSLQRMPTKPREYPLACAGINLVCSVINLLELNPPAPPAGSSSSSSSASNGNSASFQQQRPEAGQATVMFNNLTQTVTGVASKLMNGAPAPAASTQHDGVMIVSSQQESMTSLMQRLEKNKLFRFFVRNKARISKQNEEQAAMMTTKYQLSASDSASSIKVQGKRASLSSVPPASFSPASLAYLSTIHSTSELLAVLFPILDDLWVEEKAGYFEFNSVLRSVVAAMEHVLIHALPKDMQELDRMMRERLKSEHVEKERQRKMQERMMEKQRSEAKKHHHPIASPVKQRHPPQHPPQPPASSTAAQPPSGAASAPAPSTTDDLSRAIATSNSATPASSPSPVAATSSPTDSASPAAKVADILDLSVLDQIVVTSPGASAAPPTFGSPATSPPAASATSTEAPPAVNPAPNDDLP